MNDPLHHHQAKLAYEIDPSDLKAALDADEAIVVVDAGTTDGLDRSRLVVAHCDGIGCNASTKGALNMTRLGFKVKELIGGIEWWERDGYDVARGGKP